MVSVAHSGRHEHVDRPRLNTQIGISEHVLALAGQLSSEINSAVSTQTCTSGPLVLRRLIPMFTRPISLFNLGRSGCSRWTITRTLAEEGLPWNRVLEAMSKT